ncbi:hypothetical protein LTR15_007533 [Elasticomyces elasticus]|nr:hypothetical protein LTR15_007533 [Elasticomyces elasticus]
MAYMYHALTTLLLLSNRPQFTGMGENIMATQYEADRQCLVVLKRVCGIARSHPGPTLCLSVLAIAHSGHLLQQPVAQQQAYDILRQAQKFCVADSSQVVDTRLRSAWGWPIRL